MLIVETIARIRREHFIRGKTIKEIARDLQIGEKTVKTHVSNVVSKLGVQSRTQAALHAVRTGLVPAAELARN